MPRRKTLKKRAPGGGRKAAPIPTTAISVRVPCALRAQLEIDASVRGLSLSAYCAEILTASTSAARIKSAVANLSAL